MIPPGYFSPDVSRGEQDVFRRLRDDPGTDGWFVLHSLDVARHRRQVSGELDFVVIIPGKGVLCLEVKGCRKLGRNGGKWYYGDDSKGDVRGPFKQVAGTMHSLHDRLVDSWPVLRKVPFWTAVVLPYVEFNWEPEEWHEWQVIDTARFRARPISSLLLSVMSSARHLLSETPSAKWFREEERLPTEEQCKLIVQALRGDFEFYEGGSGRRGRIQDELLRYTEEQFEVLDYLQTSPRAVVAGPAGTGKTLLAMEMARRSAGQGMKTLLLCFNHNLANWLQDQTKYSDLIRTSSLHSFLLQLAGEAGGTTREDCYWSTTLPELAVERMLVDEPGAEMFDLLVVDEAQDVLRPAYLDPLDLALAGGLSAGKWRFFGDFEEQSLYGTGESAMDALASARGLRFSELCLTVNCRNSPAIARVVEAAGDLDPPYSRIRRPDDGLSPDIVFFTDESDQVEALAAVLTSLRKQGYKNAEIAVLSTRAAAPSVSHLPASVQSTLSMPGSISGIVACTIHAFKGLEAPAVVVTDIWDLSPSVRQLLYVGTSRALSSLTVLAHVSTKNAALKMLAKGGTARD